MSERALAGPADPVVAQAIADAIWDKKGFEVVALEVTEIVGYTDLMVICSASSVRHASALADGVIDALRSGHNLRAIGKEGNRDGRWVLLDYGDFVVHVFHGPVREYYELDRLYADAPRIELQEPEWLAQAERDRLYATASDWVEHDEAAGDLSWDGSASDDADEPEDEPDGDEEPDGTNGPQAEL